MAYLSFDGILQNDILQSATHPEVSPLPAPPKIPPPPSSITLPQVSPLLSISNHPSVSLLKCHPSHVSVLHTAHTRI